MLWAFIIGPMQALLGILLIATTPPSEPTQTIGLSESSPSQLFSLTQTPGPTHPLPLDFYFSFFNLLCFLELFFYTFYRILVHVNSCQYIFNT